MKPIEATLALSVGVSLGQPVREVAPPVVRVHYSAISQNETPLPAGLRPVALITSRTGALLVGDYVFGYRSDIERAAGASLSHIQQVAAALPIDANDERLVDALVAKQTAQRGTRALRRREGTSG